MTDGKSGSATDHRILGVSVAPLKSVEVEYFESKSLSLYFTNRSDELLLVDGVTLQFQTDGSMAAHYTDHPCALRIEPKDGASFAVQVTPTPIYLANTNSIELMVKYRVDSKGKLGAPVTERHPASYLIIKPSRHQLGDAFISFKQPEDRKLAMMIERYAERSGFTPYVAMEDPQPGTQQWKRIEAAIKRSRAAFIIWTLRTEWGKGVQREVRLCRKYSVREVLLIEEGVAIPAEYSGTNVEYSRFLPDEPARKFDHAVCAAREAVLTGKKGKRRS
jgi:hypothetical protein